MIHTHSYWNRLEWYCRDLTKSYDSVNVISGPLFLPEEDEASGKKIVKYEVSSTQQFQQSVFLLGFIRVVLAPLGLSGAPLG